MKFSARSLVLSCVLLYAVVGFVAGACPSSPEQTAQHRHHHHTKPATHALACAWACHASANQTAVDALPQLVPVWLVATWLILPAVRLSVSPLAFSFARPPPLSFA
jgi:hypothetical protein